MCLLNQAREKDRANYTCVAENVANRRLSPPARLNVHGKLAPSFIFCPLDQWFSTGGFRPTFGSPKPVFQYYE